jgi:hypothetical protein
MRSRLRRLLLTALGASCGFVGGCTGGLIGYLPVNQPARYPFLAETTPLPHHVPKFPGGVALRFAMVHDVIHERFPRHGRAYYEERNRLTRQKLQTLSNDRPDRFPLLDDLGAGLERLGKSDEAAAVIRGKLARQRALGQSGRDLYTSYANLGTFLIHGAAKDALGGDPAALARFREGIDFIKMSVKVNPEAHFGREVWQAAIAEFLLAAAANPELLRTFDCLGNRLDPGIEELLNREANWTGTGYGRPTDAAFSQGKVDDELPAFFVPGVDVENPERWGELSPIRQHITKVGAERGWEDVPVPSHRTPVAFDEPVLGIIGMWRQGGGANPHFALALGETMLRVGQRYIAWSAFERTARLADRYSPDSSIRSFLVDHCRNRQRAIEKTLLARDPVSENPWSWEVVSPPPSPESVARLTEVFDNELAEGEPFQREYQEAEAVQIEAGISIESARFINDLAMRADHIASPSGSEEWFARIPRPRMTEYLEHRQRAFGVLGAGIAAMATALLLRRRRRHRKRLASAAGMGQAGTTL